MKTIVKPPTTPPPTKTNDLFADLHPYGDRGTFPCDALDDTLRKLRGILTTLMACTDEETGDFLIPGKYISATIDVAFDLTESAQTHVNEWENYQRNLWEEMNRRVEVKKC